MLVKAYLVSLQFVDTDLVRLEAQAAALLTDGNACANALKAALPAADKFKFS